MLADIVVLTRDILATNAQPLSDVAVDTTIFNGKIVYRRAR